MTFLRRSVLAFLGWLLLQSCIGFPHATGPRVFADTQVESQDEGANPPTADVLFHIPEDAIAMYHLDPRAFEGSAEVAQFLPAAVNLGKSMGVIDSKFFPIVDGLSAASMAGAVPHSLCVLSLDAEYDETASRGFRIDELQAVLVLHTAADHRSYLSGLQTILNHYAPPKSADADEDHQSSQRLFTLPDGTSAGRYLPADRPIWQTIEWASTADAFIVGLGHGAIEKWVRNQAATTKNRIVALHHAKLTNLDVDPRELNKVETQSFLSMWINFDRLHEVVPDIVAQGRPRRMLTTWQLDNARNWMWHGRRRGKYLLFDITWQRRSDQRDVVAHRSLTLGHWPGDLQLPEPTCDFVAVIPMDFAQVYERIIQAYRATMSPSKLPAYDELLLSHRRRHRTTYEHLWPAFKPYLILSNFPAPPVPVPGACTVYFELEGKRPNARIVQNRMDSILKTFLKSPTPQDMGDSAVRYDRKNRLYYLQLERSGMLRIPAWGWAENRYLIGGWGPPVVTTSREWLRTKEH